MFKAFGIMLLGLLFTLILKSKSNTYAGFAEIGVGIILVMLGINEIMPVFYKINEISTDNELSEVCATLFKAFGICLISAEGSELCRSLEQSSLAGAIEFFGKCEILLLCLPYINEIFSLLGEQV